MVKIEGMEALQKAVKQPSWPLAIHRYLPKWLSTRDKELDVTLPDGISTHYSEREIQASDLAHLINRFSGYLEHLAVDCFWVTFRDDNDVTLLANAIAASPKLVSLVIKGAIITGNFKLLGEAMEKLLLLEIVDVPRYCDFLLPLLAHPGSVLRRITIYNAIRDPTNVQQFFDACQESAALEHLHFYIDYFDPLHLQALRGLIRNDTTLKCLILEDIASDWPVPEDELIKTQLTLTTLQKTLSSTNP
jgi:hypothetical protein